MRWTAGRNEDRSYLPLVRREARIPEFPIINGSRHQEHEISHINHWEGQDMTGLHWIEFALWPSLDNWCLSTPSRQSTAKAISSLLILSLSNRLSKPTWQMSTALTAFFWRLHSAQAHLNKFLNSQGSNIEPRSYNMRKESKFVLRNERQVKITRNGT